MRMVGNWRELLKYAWSIRLNILATLLSGAEVWFTFIDPYSLPIPNGVFAALAMVTTILANVARLVAQKRLSNVQE